MGIHNDDFVKNLVSCSTHDTLLFFTNNGKVYRAKGYEIPEYGRTAKGIPIINLLGIDSSESIQAIIAVTGEAEEGHY
ncbi:DNA gyrase C-terminal beta-propeller domain-containing protein, partial [Citrobacter freundii]